MAFPASAVGARRAASFPSHIVVTAAAVAIALVILVAAQQSQPRLALYWVLGLGVGLVLQRGRLCFAGAFRDLFLMRNGGMLRAILVGLAMAAPVFALIEARAVPEPGFGALASGAHVVPLGLNLPVGGVLFGIGMVVAGGCVSGTLYRIGEGYLASWASLFGILVGLSAAAHTWNAWYTFTIQSAPLGWLPTSVGYGGAVVLTWLALAAAYVGTFWWESRGASGPGFTVPSNRKTVGDPVTLGDHLRAVYRNVLGKGWPPLAAVTALVLLNIAAFLVDTPLGVTGELAAWADRAAGLVGLAAGPLLGVDTLAGCSLAVGANGVINPTTLLDAGLVFGALIAALAAREFKVRVARQRRRYVQSFAGGALMGYGAGIGIGCTIGAFFSAIPSLGLSGWIFGLALLLGAAVGTQVIRRIA
ncbi:MAG: YeeE/YedE family protein [Chloroflexi bacterium]|nr:YeeE/YedE family protein [Chloroflexota bacterium]MBV9897409.1 YeeE/YedE family protein [Chloroflexota bacterium]